MRWLQDEVECTPAAIARAEALAPDVPKWLELVRTTAREREPGQMDRVLADLGEMPEAEDADALALWTCALLNPVPALGVAREARAMVLEAADAERRLGIVGFALTDSIKRMREMPAGPIECEPPPGFPSGMSAL